ncbi:hypothetical protein LDENG_00278180, partial [Lucifuga dentata]
ITSLHWFLVRFRIEFKILLITFKAVLGLAPSCITEMLTPYESVRSLRSSGGTLLAVPKSRLKSKGDRAFAVRALLLWNDLPEEIMLADSVFLLNPFLKPIFIDLLLCDVILKLSFFLLLSYLYLLFIYMFIY